mmetsp:Transcript_8094/g.15810  ORF Transcript_8094/g.15810 Transcript_8094/m.15810 type:complete len:149 (+) Transcript_8094:372-818(+)
MFCCSEVSLHASPFSPFESAASLFQILKFILSIGLSVFFVFHFSSIRQIVRDGLSDDGRRLLNGLLCARLTLSVRSPVALLYFACARWRPQLCVKCMTTVRLPACGILAKRAVYMRIPMCGGAHLCMSIAVHMMGNQLNLDFARGFEK